jgi:mono/diheme cytochrome c family protein
LRPKARISSWWGGPPGLQATPWSPSKIGTRASRADQGVRPTNYIAFAAILLALLALAGCRQDMQDQPKFIPLRPSSFFADGRSERPLIDGTVARGHLNDDTAFYTGKGADGKPLDTFPFPVTKEVVERGQNRFNVYCAPCHDRTGSGDGMIVKRGYHKPPSYHIDRLRQLPNGYIYDVITSGLGAMPDYAAQIPPRDRWAIVAYVRALQMSQNASIDDVPADARGQLGGAK